MATIGAVSVPSPPLLVAEQVNVEPVRRRPHHPDARVVTCTGRPASHDEPDGPGHRRVAHHRPPRDVSVALLVEDVGFVLAVVVVFEIKVSEGRIRVSIQRLRLDPSGESIRSYPLPSTLVR